MDAFVARPPTEIGLANLADACLSHLVENPEQLAEFMVHSGLTPSALRGLVGTEAFAHGLVDYVVSNEPLLLAVAASRGWSPESIGNAWKRLHTAEN